MGRKVRRERDRYQQQAVKRRAGPQVRFRTIPVKIRQHRAKESTERDFRRWKRTCDPLEYEGQQVRNLLRIFMIIDFHIYSFCSDF